MLKTSQLCSHKWQEVPFTASVENEETWDNSHTWARISNQWVQYPTITVTVIINKKEAVKEANFTKRI